MSMEENLRKYIDELIQEVEQELDEATTTAGVDGYQTPFAFGSGRDKDKKKQKKNIDVTGYTKVKDIDESVNEETYKVAGRPVTLIKGKKPNGTDWKVKFQNGKETSLSDVLSLIKPFPKGIKESVNEAELKLGVKYVNKQGKEGFIQTGGSKNSKDWVWFDGKTKHPYDKVKKELKPSKDQKKTGFGDYLKQGGRVWDNVNPTDSPSVNEAKTYKKGDKLKIKLKNGKKFDVVFDAYAKQKGVAFGKFKDGSGEYDTKPFDLDTIVESVNEAKVKRPVNRWLELKNDDTMHAQKKMAMGLKELKYQLAETEKFFNWYNKIKNINELDSDKYWKRTNKHIYKIKERLVNIARTIKEIEK